jgi:hypothetical protein
VLSVVEDGLQVSEAAVKAGVTRQALHSWLSRYAGGGLEALADRSHRPRSCPHQMDPAVEVRLPSCAVCTRGVGADRLRYHWAGRVWGRCRVGRRSAGRWSGWPWSGRGHAGRGGSTAGGSVAGRWSCGSWT